LDKQELRNVECLPGDQPWHSPLWDAVRIIKGALHDLVEDGEEAWQWVRSVVPVERFLDVAGAANCDCPETEDEVQAEFVNSWDKIQYLPGEMLLDVALREAGEYPVVPPRDRGSPGYARFLAVCRAIASQSDTAVIAIPEERWAALLGVRVNTVSVWRQWAVKDGILTMTREHSRSGRRATEFRVDLSNLPVAELTAKQE
jgi:hypothetical protein